MALIKCPDCGKDISDAAPTCIGCGRQMKATESVAVEKTERTGGRYEMIGFLIILASMGSCSVGAASSTGGGGWVGLSVAGFIVGFIVFLVGRFK